MQRFNHARWWMVVMALLAGTAFAAPARGQAAVLEHVPADAPLAVVVPSISGAADKVSMLNQRLGINDPMLADPLSLAPVMALRNGVDMDGAAAIVMLTMPDPQQPGAEPVMGVLLPMSDYQAFLGNFNGARANGDVTTVELDGQPVHVKEAGGGYAILSDNQQSVADFQSPGDATAHRERMGTVGLEAAEGADLYVVTNLEKLGPMMLQQATQALMMAQQMAEPEMLPMLDFYGTMLDEVLTSGGGLITGLRIS